MCNVTEEMVLRADQRLVQRMKSKKDHSALRGDSIFVPVNVFGMTLYRSLAIDQINAIYGQAREKVTGKK